MDIKNLFNSNKLLDRMFRKADGVVWDLMTGQIGVKTADGIVTLTKNGDSYSVNQNLMDDFGMPIPAYAQQTPVAAVNVGDIIVRGARDSIAWVIEKIEKDGSPTKFRLMKPTGDETTWTPPKVTMLGFDSGVMVLRSLVSMLPNGQQGLGQMQGMLMPMMMAGMLDGDDDNGMLPMMMMMQQNGADQSGMGNMMNMLLMSKLLGKNGPSFGGSGRKNPF